jgi:N-acetylglucosamine-6-phosphate deacetylase
MTPGLLIRNARLQLPGQLAEQGDLRVSNGMISELGISLAPDQETVIDAQHGLCTPGLVDLHTHGIGTFLYERSDEDLVGACAMLPRFGVTAVLPTLYRVLDRRSFNLLESLAQAARNVRIVTVPGFHLEGPFLALAGAGAMTQKGDVGLLSDLLAACGGFVRVMSVSPETPGILPVIEELVRRSIVPFITHTRASADQTQRAIDAGARHATHFYDVFPIPPETEPGARAVGAVEVLLADERCSVDFICDGIHVAPVAVRAAVAAKGWGRVACISDSNTGAGLPAAEYDLPWGYRIRADPHNAARICDPEHPENGALAGSTLTMNVGVANLLRWFVNDSIGPWTAATSTPARIAGLTDSGSIQVGYRADLVIWNDDLTPRVTIHGGHVAFDSSERIGA